MNSDRTVRSNNARSGDVINPRRISTLGTVSCNVQTQGSVCVHHNAEGHQNFARWATTVNSRNQSPASRIKFVARGSSGVVVDQKIPTPIKLGSFHRDRLQHNSCRSNIDVHIKRNTIPVRKASGVADCETGPYAVPQAAVAQRPKSTKVGVDKRVVNRLAISHNGNDTIRRSIVSGTIWIVIIHPVAS